MRLFVLLAVAVLTARPSHALSLFGAAAVEAAEGSVACPSSTLGDMEKQTAIIHQLDEEFHRRDPDGLRQIKQRLSSLAITHHMRQRTASGHATASVGAAVGSLRGGYDSDDTKGGRISREAAAAASGGGGSGGAGGDSLKANGADARSVTMNVMLLTGAGTHSQHQLLQTLARVLYNTELPPHHKPVAVSNADNHHASSASSPVLVIEGRDFSSKSQTRPLYELVSRQLVSCARSMIVFHHIDLMEPQTVSSLEPLFDDSPFALFFFTLSPPTSTLSPLPQAAASNPADATQSPSAARADQIRSLWRARMRQMVQTLTFDVPEVTVDLNELISRMDRARHTKLIDINKKKDPFVELSDNFLGQQLVVRQIKAFLRDEIKRRKMTDGPTNFVFVGIPGTGKTYLAGLIARILNRPLKTYDMANYKEASDIDSFTGPRQGLVGEGYLVGELRDHPKSVILFDEIEKAHPSIVNEFLLAVLGNGAIQDKKDGSRVSTRDAVWILTSNCFEDVVQHAWTEAAAITAPSAAASHSITNQTITDFLTSVQSVVNTKFLPDDKYICPGINKKNPFASQALIDRLQGRVFVFTPFFDRELMQIAALELERLHTKMSTWDATKLNVYWTDAVLEFFANRNRGKSVRTLQNDILTSTQSVIFPLLDSYESAVAAAGGEAKMALLHRVVLSVQEMGTALVAVPVHGDPTDFGAVDEPATPTHGMEHSDPTTATTSPAGTSTQAGTSQPAKRPAGGSGGGSALAVDTELALAKFSEQHRWTKWLVDKLKAFASQPELMLGTAVLFATFFAFGFMYLVAVSAKLAVSLAIQYIVLFATLISAASALLWYFFPQLFWALVALLKWIIQFVINHPVLTAIIAVTVFVIIVSLRILMAIRSRASPPPAPVPAAAANQHDDDDDDADANANANVNAAAAVRRNNGRDDLRHRSAAGAAAAAAAAPLPPAGAGAGAGGKRNKHKPLPKPTPPPQLPSSRNGSPALKPQHPPGGVGPDGPSMFDLARQKEDRRAAHNHAAAAASHLPHSTPVPHVATPPAAAASGLSARSMDDSDDHEAEPGAATTTAGGATAAGVNSKVKEKRAKHAKAQLRTYPLNDVASDEMASTEGRTDVNPIDELTAQLSGLSVSDLHNYVLAYAALAHKHAPSAVAPLKPKQVLEEYAATIVPPAQATAAGGTAAVASPPASNSKSNKK